MLQLSSDPEKRLQYFKNQKNNSNREYWQRMGKFDFNGKRVLEIGCGNGAMAVNVVELGASEVVAIDIVEDCIQFAKRYVPDLYPEVSDRITYRCISLADVSAKQSLLGKFDVVISKDAFEHIDNLSQMMQQIASILRDGGALLTGFGPLYYSPFGDHGRYLNHKYKWIPWLPLIPEFMLFRLASTFHVHPIKSSADLGLNKLTPQQFRELLSEQDWAILKLDYNRGERKGMQVMRFLRKVPFLETLFTVNVYAQLIKPR